MPKASRQWGEFLRGQKPGDPPGTPRTPTNRELRGEGRSDAAPAPGLSENPAAVRGMSFGWLLENLGLNGGEQPDVTSPLPEYAAEEGSAPPAQSPPTNTRESISNDVDSDDEDDLETVIANGAAIATPRQVMRQEYYRMVQEARGKSRPVNRNLFVGTPEELEKVRVGWEGLSCRLSIH